MLRELERRGEGRAGPALGAEVAGGQRLARVLGERGLGVEGIDVGRAAVHEEVDDALGLGREVRLLGREWVGRGIGVRGEEAAPRPSIA